MAINQKVTIFDAKAVYFAERNTATGSHGPLFNVGLSTAFKVTLTQDKKELKSPKGELIQSIPLIPSASVSIDMRDITPENLAFGLKAVLKKLAAAVGKTKTVTTTQANEMVTLDAVNVSNVVVKEGEVAQVAGTDYGVDQKFGSVTLVAPGTYTITYDTAEQSGFGFLTDSAREYFIRIEAIDLASSKPAVLEIFRVKFSALSDFSFIGEDFATIPLEGDMLADNTRDADDEYGQYAKYYAV